MKSSDFSPKITVIITTCNRSSLLTRAIDSVLKQSYRNFEIVIIDDCSIDDTAEIVEKYQQQYCNIVYSKHNKQLGVASARNTGANLASGELITGLDDDDEFSPERLSNLLEHFDEKWAFVCSGLFYSKNDELIAVRNNKEVFDLQDMLFSNRASHALMFKKRFLEIGGQDSDLLSCEDYDFWLRMTEKYGSALRLESCTYIIHDDHGLERKGTSDKKIKGQYQFIDKHKSKMTKSQYNAQLLQVYIREAKPLPLSALINMISPKITWKIIKYFLWSHFQFLNNIEQKILLIKSKKMVL